MGRQTSRSTVLLLSAAAALGFTTAAGTAGGVESCAALPPVIIGCWQLLERERDPEVAVQTLMAYAEAGFTAFDTADIYGPSEKILGRFRSAFAAKHGDAAADDLVH